MLSSTLLAERGLMRDLARNQHLAVILIDFQGLVTVASTGASGLDQTGCVARLDPLRIEHAGDSTTGKYNAGILAVGASYTF
jgi:hypothetical protein